ncbi:BLOC-2 complex member HPS5 homolog [Bombyx mori]|uniref:Hermansky-Pudlak syndrome 5 n=1 Tax=Bombyx mori TaxID=7091 RepID=M0QVX1_BOMMO|nr:Hermansky-Pudlak syndrome 5 protein homolog [Bombyx mori]BAK95882.1 Hermansky-Pudlak syndrome 5 [Bombyx mori]
MSNIMPPPYILQELPNVTECINYPIKNVQRIKYTCFDVSKSLLAFGATSGGIYIFNKNPCEFVQLIPNKDGAITRLSISADEKHVGFANGRGVITVSGCEQGPNALHSVVTSKEHQGNEVTALAWSGNMLFSGDDVGKIAVLQLQSFIAKTMFQSSSQTIMNLDSRVCQIDVKSYMLLVSTLTRCYLCDTTEEQYRQIGQKLRDGEFGACFVNKENAVEINIKNKVKDYSEVRKYSIINEDSSFAVGRGLDNTLVFAARPSSRLWEAAVDGTVKRTHQFKQILGRSPMNILTVDAYEHERHSFDEMATINADGLSVNFPRIFNLNGVIFSYKKDALFFLNLDNVDHTIWCARYKSIADCKVYGDAIYVWLNNGSLINLKFMKIDKFLIKCYVDDKHRLCANLCAQYKDYLLANEMSTRLHILAGLKEKIDDKELLETIHTLLVKFERLKENEAKKVKSGIYVVDNTYNAQTSLMSEMDKTIDNNEEYSFGNIPPEAMQTLKDFSVSVTDRLNTSKKILKEKWDDFEGKMKHLSVEKPQEKLIMPPAQTPKIISRDEPLALDQTPVLERDIVFKQPSQKAIEIENNISSDKDDICKSLYQYFRLSLVGKEDEKSNLISIIESFACDIRSVYELMRLLEDYCASVGSPEESKYVPNNIFLKYLSETTKRAQFLDCIISDEVLYKYFVDSCISVNLKGQKHTDFGCECGYPLPYARTKQNPIFFELIDEFIERQWSSPTKEQCYDTCKRMPYLWRKILYLRRNEDLVNILRILMQMLDESLLHNFLPQFTLDSWSRAVQLYATLHANVCLNCSKKFSNVSVKDTLCWDDLGALMIKSVGGRNSLRIMEEHSRLIEPGEVTVKFYHTCLMVTMFEKYDSTVTAQLVDALYTSYRYEDSKHEICNLLRNTTGGQLKNTSLPISVAAKSRHWGLKPLASNDKNDFTDILDNIADINNGVSDCALCGLPLRNDVLIKDGGLWVFKCGHTFHGACLDLNKLKLCPHACACKSVDVK